jgi:hypothetical protein
MNPRGNFPEKNERGERKNDFKTKKFSLHFFYRFADFLLKQFSPSNKK